MVLLLTKVEAGQRGYFIQMSGKVSLKNMTCKLRCKGYKIIGHEECRAGVGVRKGW